MQENNKKIKNKIGRPALSEELKKKRYSVVLIPKDAQVLISKFGTLTRAIRSVVGAKTNNDALDTLKQVKLIIDNALNK